MQVSELCETEVVCCGPEATVGEIARLMREHHVGDVVVTGRNVQLHMPLGIVTDRDIVVQALAAEVELALLTAGDMMSAPPVTVDNHATLEEALQTMHQHKVRRLPVVREDGTLYGLLAADSLIYRLAAMTMSMASVMARQPRVEAQKRT